MNKRGVFYVLTAAILATITLFFAYIEGYRHGTSNVIGYFLDKVFEIDPTLTENNIRALVEDVERRG